MLSLRNKKGFTLTEVMIGISILTVAIVSATNLLVGLLDTNQNNLKTLQAYYFAQEGLEAVRNIRDSNWLLNRNWLGDDETRDLWGGKFEIGQEYSIHMEFGSGSADPKNFSELKQYGPWEIDSPDRGEIYKLENFGRGKYFASGDPLGVDTGFKRTISFKSYDCKNDLCVLGKENSYVLVESKVTFEKGGKAREVVLSEVLSDWKGGAF